MIFNFVLSAFLKNWYDLRTTLVGVCDVVTMPEKIIGRYFKIHSAYLLKNSFGILSGPMDFFISIFSRSKNIPTSLINKSFVMLRPVLDLKFSKEAPSLLTQCENIN